MVASIVRVGACQGCRRCTARDTRSLSLSLVAIPVCMRRERTTGAAKCTTVARSHFPRAHAHAYTWPCGKDSNICVRVPSDRYRPLPAPFTRYAGYRGTARTCTRDDVASDRCTDASPWREATYVIPVTRFSNGGIRDIWPTRKSTRIAQTRR